MGEVKTGSKGLFPNSKRDLETTGNITVDYRQSKQTPVKIL